jgi:peptidoglycan/LPS O-acetylase OafA/YrhL
LTAHQLLPTRLLWLRLPLIRTLQSGRGSVAIFFVISGLVLSLRAVTLVRQRRYSQALESLAQSAFRRPFRIYPPIFAITFFVAAVLVRQEGWYIRHKYNFTIPPRDETLSAQLTGWAWNMTALVDHSRYIPPGVHMYRPPYDGYLWTIPTEMLGAVYVFMVQLALLRVRTAARVTLVAAFAFWLCWVGSIDMGMFVTGMLLTEVTVYLSSTAEAPPQQRRTMVDIISQAGVYLLAIVGFWILGYPDEADTSSVGFALLAQMTPTAYVRDAFVRQFFWCGFGAILFVAALVLCPMTGVPAPSASKTEYDLLPSSSPTDSLPSSSPTSHRPTTTPERPSEPLLRRPFVTPFAQYLGRLSFALYLCQSAVIKTLSAHYTIPARAAFEEAERLAHNFLNEGAKHKAIAMADNAVASVVLQAEFDARMSGAWCDYAWVATKNGIVSFVVLFWMSDLFYLWVDRHAATLGRIAMQWVWVKDD